jgi:hypothetical protein
MVVQLLDKVTNSVLPVSAERLSLVARKTTWLTQMQDWTGLYLKASKRTSMAQWKKRRKKRRKTRAS